MLVTQADLEYRCKDGRWHQVSTGVWFWFASDKRYEIQYRRWGNWEDAVAPALLAHTKCRIRLKQEYVDYPPKGV